MLAPAIPLAVWGATLPRPPFPGRCALRYRIGVSISDALRATVLRRFRRLDRVERSIVMRASVIGRDFDLHVAVAVAACSEARARAALENACSLELVIASGRDRYSFRHALTHDIIYDELLKTRIRPLHRRITRVLEGTLSSGQPVLEELAYHSWVAGDARRALRYNELVGDHAAAVHAGDDARRYYSRARSMTEIGSLGYSRLTEKLHAVEQD